MNDESSNKSDLEGLANNDTSLPNPLVVALLIIAVSFLVGIVFAVIQVMFNFTLPGGTAISTMVPAMVVGYIYGSKRQSYFPREFRIKVIAIWVAISLVFTFLIFQYIELPIQELMSTMTFIIPVLIGLLFIAAVVCYFAFKFGEKIGMDAAKKKAV